MGSPVPAIVNDDIEASGHGDENLMQRLVRVSRPRSAAGNVIELVYPGDLERDMARALDEGQVASRLGNFGEIDQPATLDFDVSIEHFPSSDFP
jgi:hypothetical protein